MTGYVPPWSPGYTSTSNPVSPDVQLPWGTNPVVIDPAPTPVLPDPAPTPTPAPAPVAPVNTTSFTQQVEAEVNNLANQALQEARKKVLESLKAPADPTLDPNDLKTAAARSRAIRTLVIGLLTAMGYGVVAALGTAGNIDFFSKTGWISVGTLVAGAAVHSVISYVARLNIKPKAD